MKNDLHAVPDWPDISATWWCWWSADHTGASVLSRSHTHTHTHSRSHSHCLLSITQHLILTAFCFDLSHPLPSHSSHAAPEMRQGFTTNQVNFWQGAPLHTRLLNFSRFGKRGRWESLEVGVDGRPWEAWVHNALPFAFCSLFCSPLIFTLFSPIFHPPSSQILSLAGVLMVLVPPSLAWLRSWADLGIWNLQAFPQFSCFLNPRPTPPPLSIYLFLILPTSPHGTCLIPLVPTLQCHS